MRGKILNVERKDDAALYKNTEISALIIGLGLGTKGNGGSSKAKSSSGKKGSSSRRTSSSVAAIEEDGAAAADGGDGDVSSVEGDPLKGLR